MASRDFLWRKKTEDNPLKDRFMKGKLKSLIKILNRIG